jgi:hypothetical protein
MIAMLSPEMLESKIVDIFQSPDPDELEREPPSERQPTENPQP